MPKLVIFYQLLTIRQFQNLLDLWKSLQANNIIHKLQIVQSIQKNQNRNKYSNNINKNKVINKQLQMLVNQQQLSIEGRNFGKIKPIRCNYYTNPQPLACMFGFTLSLTIGLSLLMITCVFTSFYHRIIGTILCLYVIYRFTSLGLSNPGLAVETVDEHQMRTNDLFRENQIIEDNSYHHEQPNQISNRETNTHGARQHFSKFGFYNFCNHCKVPIQRNTRHCKICKTCIDGFDHHCIWIGKCIGKNNMWQFKEFLCFVFVTLIYALILSIQSSKIQKIS